MNNLSTSLTSTTYASDANIHNRRNRFAVDLFQRFKDDIIEQNYRKYLFNSSYSSLGRYSLYFVCIHMAEIIYNVFLFSTPAMNGLGLYVGKYRLELWLILLNVLYCIIFATYNCFSNRRAQGKPTLNYRIFSRLISCLYILLFGYTYLITHLTSESCADEQYDIAQNTTCEVVVSETKTPFTMAYFAGLFYLFIQPLAFNLTLLANLIGYSANFCAFMGWCLFWDAFDEGVLLGMLILLWIAILISTRLDSVNRSSFIRYCTLRDANLTAHTELEPFTSANVSNWLNELRTFGSRDGNNPLQRFEINFGDIVFQQRIAAGGGGQVFRGEYEQRPVAIKQLFTTLMDKHDLAEFCNEVSAMTSLGINPNIVRLYGISKSGDDIFLVMEFCEKSLADVLATPALWPTPQQILNDPAACMYVLRVAKQICSAMAYLHANNFVHLDLKPGNVLLESAPVELPRSSTTSELNVNLPLSSLSDSTKLEQPTPAFPFHKWQAKLCDFGLSKNTKSPKQEDDDVQFDLLRDFSVESGGKDKKQAEPQHGMGTAAFLAPECLDPLINPTAPSPFSDRTALSFEQLCRVDVYAFGVLVAAMCCNNEIYLKEELSIKQRGISGPDVELELLLAIKHGLRPDLPPLPDTLTRLIDACWSTNPQLRPSFRELLSSSSFTGVG